MDLGVVRMILESPKDVDTSGEIYHSFPIILLKTCLFHGWGYVVTGGYVVTRAFGK